MAAPKVSESGPIVSIIVAMSENRVIGVDNELPWRLPADLQHFKATTMAKPVLMGRKTFESIGRALPGRRNIVVSRTPGYAAAGCETVGSVQDALRRVEAEPEIMVIGGASFYEQLLPQAHRVYLTLVHANIDGDARFPEMDLAQWREVSRTDHQADDRNPIAYSFLVYERR